MKNYIYFSFLYSKITLLFVVFFHRLYLHAMYVKLQ